ncbi:SDR family NAD(P)-dependent oxidoreductase [Sphingorhabdus sp. EL138]|uniref:SDR family NAD(P)-dependent oxidoreductase n=1 Tax=Sphingorhabdus sp. EL138 TaxID=2073156 RepID=UPI000D68C095|nr:SDR family NAD(P)-dependent oxidoreductase [Sphingorhabdus sp. EL138]
MKKTILITGATDGIGLETAKRLWTEGADLLLHGRNPAKLEKVADAVSALSGHGTVETHVADLSNLSDVAALAEAVIVKQKKLDVLINNAGVFHIADPILDNGQDVRFVVNTLAPYLLTKKFMPLLGVESRVVNLSSAAQAAVDLDALRGKRQLSDGEAYAQSKLALTMWSFALTQQIGDSGPIIISVNPASMLGSKMVKDAYGVNGGDLRIGADILTRAAMTDEFADANGKYFDNDRGIFTAPHPDALDEDKRNEIVAILENLLGVFQA